MIPVAEQPEPKPPALDFNREVRQRGEDCIRQLSVAFLFAETIRRISDGESVTSQFAEQNSNF